jgi:hypothetical protein
LYDDDRRLKPDKATKRQTSNPWSERFLGEASLFWHHFAMAQKAKKAEFDASAVGVFSYPGSHHVNSDYGLGPNAIGTSGPASRRDPSRTEKRHLTPRFARF